MSLHLLLQPEYYSIVSLAGNIQHWPPSLPSYMSCPWNVATEKAVLESYGAQTCSW